MEEFAVHLLTALGEEVRDLRDENELLKKKLKETRTSFQNSER